MSCKLGWNHTKNMSLKKVSYINNKNMNNY